MMPTQPQKTAKFAILSHGHAGFPNRVKRSEGSDTTPRLAHSESTERRVYKPQLRQKRKDHAAQRGRDAFGTATRISASLLRRLSAFFRSVSDQDPKAAKFAVLIPGPGMFVNVQLVSRVMIAPPPKTPPISACVPLCAIFLGEPSVYKPQFRQKRKRSRSPAGPRRLRNSDTHERIAVPQALRVLREHTRPSPKSGKVCRSDTWPRRVSETCETLRG